MDGILALGYSCLNGGLHAQMFRWHFTVFKLYIGIGIADDVNRYKMIFADGIWI